MIRDERAVIADSLWTATAGAAPDCPPLTAPAEADVAIVGAGYTGLSAALALARAGRRVIVLEAQEPGWGASGRNGGQVNPGLKEGPAGIKARFGDDLGGRMVRLSGSAGQVVFDLIARHGIDCAPVQTGWIRAAHTDRAVGEMHALAADWQAHGAEVEPLDGAKAARLLGTDAYKGGLIDRRGGNLHPLRYAYGLARAAQAAGARVCGQSRVVSVERIDGGHGLCTDRGAVEAAQVLLCTNGYTDGLLPPLARTVIPVRSVQVATDPLTPAQAAGILPEGQAPSDTARLLLYWRRDPEGRFVMGGRGAWTDGESRRRLAALRAASERLYPQLRGVRWAHAWGGNVAVTPDHYPHLHRPGPGVMTALGYNGRGVAMATVMGRVLANWALGQAEADLGFPVTLPRPVRFHGAHRLGVRVAVARARMLDRLGL